MKIKNTSVSTHKRGITVILVVIFFLLFSQASAQGPNLIENGGFEEGFENGVGVGWEYFHSDSVEPGFYDDTWPLVVVEGEHAQLLELINATKIDTYAGIYQNVDVEPGQSYELSFEGLVRSNEGSIEASDYGYRMQYAVDLSGNEDWTEVTEWIELPWDEQPRTGPANGSAFDIESEKTTFTATDDSVTIFFRAWKKWVGSGEGNYDLDAVQLVAVEDTTPLPETGDTQDTGPQLNLIILAASVILIAVLIGGAFINNRRRKAEVS